MTSPTTVPFELERNFEGLLYLSSPSTGYKKGRWSIKLFELFRKDDKQKMISSGAKTVMTT